MSLFMRLLALMRPQAGWMALAIGLSVLTLLANAVLLALSGWFITSMALAGLVGVSMNYFTPAAIIRACAMVRTGGRYGERIVGHDATLRFVASLRPRLFAVMEQGAPSNLDGISGAGLLNRLKGDIDRLEFAFLRVLSPLIAGSIALIAAIGFLFWQHPIFGAVALAGVLVAAFLLPLLLLPRGAEAARAMPPLSDALNNRLVEAVQGAAELGVHDSGRRHRLGVMAASDALLCVDDTLHRLNSGAVAFLQLVGLFAVVATVWLGMDLQANSGFSGPDLALALFLCLAAFDIAAMIPPAIQHIPTVMEAARRLFPLLDAAPSEAPSAQNSAPETIPAGIQFKGVTFTYHGATLPALRNVTLNIASGQRVALIGPSGSGKSTIATLLMRFYAPDVGEITLDGVALSDIDPFVLREKIALLSQDAFLFSATIRENLLLARPEASQVELEHACDTAQILPFIEGLPRGFDTFVGAHGSTMSGGQARRLALARTLLRNAPILMLDEPTEGLDAETEAQVLGAILDSDAGRTILLITHRTTRLERMDVLVQLEHGAITRAGTPQEMTQRRAALYPAQTGGVAS